MAGQGGSLEPEKQAGSPDGPQVHGVGNDALVVREVLGLHRVCKDGAQLLLVVFLQRPPQPPDGIRHIQRVERLCDLRRTPWSTRGCLIATSCVSVLQTVAVVKRHTHLTSMGAHTNLTNQTCFPHSSLRPLLFCSVGGIDNTRQRESKTTVPPPAGQQALPRRSQRQKQRIHAGCLRPACP